MALRTIEICAGVGMLGEGLRAGLQHLGLAHRTACYLEREAYPAAVIAARCEEGSLDPAPVWSDLLTFDAAAWHGAVDCIAAGFPCQDLSLAGRRAGLDGKRSGLFFDILDIADRSGAWLLFLENVAGIASATASVVDEAEGDLEERAAARVLGELADRGWHAEWLTLSASEVGASHGRERWFCLAWRPVADAEGQRGREWQRPEWSGRTEAEGASQSMENTDQHGAPERPEERRGHGARGEQGWCASDGCDAGADVGHPQRTRWTQAGCGHEEHAGREPEPGCSRMAHPPQHGRHQGRPEPGREQGRPDAAECGCAVADTQRQCGERWGEPADMACACCQVEGETRQRQWRGHAADGGLGFVADTNGQGSQGGGYSSDQTRWQEPHGHARLESRGIFAPGPADPAWAGIIAAQPYLAPALEPDFRGMVDGVAFDMGDSRAQQLKCIGNGVVPAQAAAALVVLARRAGIFAHRSAATEPLEEGTAA